MIHVNVLIRVMGVKNVLAHSVANSSNVMNILYVLRVKTDMKMNVTDKFILSPILKVAIEEANLSDYKHRVAAVIFKGKRVIAVAHNAVRSNKIPYKFKNFLESSHAEAQVIIKARRSLNNYDMLVIRINRSGKLMMAKPCEFCQEFINYVAIRNVYYSTNDQQIKIDK